MLGRMIFLLEEPSMRVLLDELLPQLFPGWVDGQHFQCIPHEGKSDLDRSIPRKLPAFHKISGARAVGRHLRPENNRSKSLQVFVAGVCRLAAEMDYQEGLGRFEGGVE